MQKIFLSGMLLCLTVLFGCNEPDTIGLDVLPGSDSLNVEYFDTVTVETSYQIDDSLRTDAYYADVALGSSHFLIGQYTDAVFGTSSASFYAQFKPKNGIDFSGKSFDSLVLNLAYLSSYGGDTSLLQTFEVYEITEDMVDTAAYYSDKTFAASSTLIGQRTFSINEIKDSITVIGTDTTKIAPRLRITLDPAFGQHIFDGSPISVDGFKTKVKGLYVKATGASSGNIITFNAASSQSSMVLYYKDDSTESVLDSLPFYMYESDGKIPRVNRFDHDYAGFGFDFTKTDKAYVQSMSGIKTKITFPYLEALKSLGSIAINKAELVINIEPGSNDPLGSHAFLSLLGIDSAGVLFNLPDQLRASSLYGGSFSNGQYRFNIAQFVQQILYGKRTDYGLYLKALGSNATQTPFRTIVEGGSGNSPLKMKLQITYTKLNP